MFIRQNGPYLVAALLAVGLIFYSIWIYTGVKEMHLLHFKNAAIWFPFVANLFSRNTLVKDLIVGLVVLFLIVFAGQVYWDYQDSLSQGDFSFENEYSWDHILYFYFFAFLLSQVFKELILKIRLSGKTKNQQ